MNAAGGDRASVRLIALRLALVYAVAAALWIILSNMALAAFDLPLDMERQVSSLKGLAFVVVTGSILWLVAARWLGNLRASEERYLRLFDNSPDGLTVYRVEHDTQGRMTDVVVADMNPVQSARQHTTSADAVGRRASDRGPMDERMRAHLDSVTSVVETTAGPDAPGLRPRPDDVVRSELYLKADGRHEELTAFAIGHDLWALAAQDVTEVRKAEQALREQQEAVRQVYIDVLDAVTGGKLVLLAEDALPAILGKPASPRWTISSPAQLAEARRAVAEITAARFPEWTGRKTLLTPVCEALENALKHAGGGSYQVFALGDRCQVAVTDHGPGIDFRTLPKATLVPGFSTIASLGMGFAIMLQLCKRVLLATGPGHTEVVLEMAVVPDAQDEAMGAEAA